MSVNAVATSFVISEDETDEFSCDVDICFVVVSIIECEIVFVFAVIDAITEFCIDSVEDYYNVSLHCPDWFIGDELYDKYTDYDI